MTRGGRGRGSGRGGQERASSPSGGAVASNPRWRGSSEPSTFHGRGTRAAGWRGAPGAASSGRPHMRGSSKSSARDDSGDKTRQADETERML